MPSSLINDWLIVEGAGVCWCPYQKQFMLDLMVKFKLPVMWPRGARWGR